MDIIIRETGERRQLNRISPGNDYDSAVDTLAQYGALADGQFEDTPDGALVCSQVVFEYWEKAMKTFSALDERRMRLVDELGESEFDTRLSAALPAGTAFNSPEEEASALAMAFDTVFDDKKNTPSKGPKI